VKSLLAVLRSIEKDQDDYCDQAIGPPVQDPEEGLLVYEHASTCELRKLILTLKSQGNL
jgi:hypothetical protein